MERLTVADLMTEELITIKAGEDLLTLRDLMSENSIRHVPVVNEQMNIVGLVSHRNLVEAIAEAEKDLPLSDVQSLLRGTKVNEIMVRGIETTDPSTEIEEAGRMMMEGKYGCLPVTDGSQLIGILTESDFVRYLVEQQSELDESPDSRIKAS